MNNKIDINNHLFHKTISLKQEGYKKKSLGNKFFMHHTTDVAKLIEFYVNENNESGRLSGQYKYGQELDLSQVKKDCMSILKSLRESREIKVSGPYLGGSIKKEYKLLFEEFIDKEFNGFIHKFLERDMINEDGEQIAYDYKVIFIEKDKINIESSLSEFLKAVIHARNSIDDGEKVKTVELSSIHPYDLEAYIKDIVPTLEAFQLLYEDLEFELQPGMLTVRKGLNKQKRNFKKYPSEVIRKIEEKLKEFFSNKKEVHINYNKPKKNKRDLKWRVLLTGLINDISKDPKKFFSDEFKDYRPEAVNFYLAESIDSFQIILTSENLGLIDE